MKGCQRAVLIRIAAGAAMLVLGSEHVGAGFATPAVAEARSDSLSAIIADYETFRADTQPAVAARRAGEPPEVWGSVTPQSRAMRARRAGALLDRLAAIDSDDTIAIAILESALRHELLKARHDLDRLPFTGDSGFHSTPVFAAATARIRNLGDAEAYVARLNDIPRYFSENMANMRRGMATGFTSHADPLATTLDQVREQVVDDPAASPLYAPLAVLPDSIAPAERARLQREGRDATQRAIAGYGELLAFLETEYAPAVREAPGLASLPGGRRIYADLVAHHTAGAGYSPEQIHRLGTAEVERIRAEMEAILRDLAFEGDLDAFITFLRTDPRFYARTPEDLMEKAAEISKRLDAILPTYFGRLPRLPYGLSPVPAAIAPGYTTGRYAQGDAEQGRAGTYLVNTYRLDQRPLYELPALTAHEAVPGHHLQIALAQEMRDVPEFRRRYYATAFGEGWALYAEKLAGEAGIYRTPYERFGALSYEMWRACRLVADTGLHWYGWSRQQAETCFVENTALSAHNIETEVTRYIGWPGQAVAYKVGELKILELRGEAQSVLGADFDLRAFHDHLLAEGSMPLSVLQARMRQWIDTHAQERTGSTPTRSP